MMTKAYSVVPSSKRLTIGLLTIILLAGFYLRASGLYRGLAGESTYVFHPDAPKQVRALQNFLSGQYFTYVGSRMYDGYPFGLNHLDEWIIRPTWKLLQATSSITSPEIAIAKRPSIEQLYYWVRSLRVLYGIAVILITFQLCRRIVPPRLAVVAALIVSLSPLSITVCKSGSGDVGLDLFGVGALLMLSLFAVRNSRFLLFLSGVGVGCAFGAKYQGLLFGGAVALWLLIQVILKQRSWKMFIGDGVCASIGCAAGVLFTIPQFVTTPSETWQYIVHGVEYIKNYNTSEEFQALAWHARTRECLGTNALPIILSIGWPIVSLALVGLALSARRTFTGHKSDSLPLACLAFAFVALLLSLAGKRYVQPFHFSYLVPVLAIGAVYAVHRMWKTGHLALRGLGSVLLATSCVSLAIRSRSEDHFWAREDLYGTAVSFAEHQVLDTRIHHNPRPRAYTSDWLIKRLALEGPNPAVFRNRPRFLAVQGGDRWRKTHIAPLPSIPFHHRHHWIFVDGPVFPINDRMMRLTPGVEHERGVVFYAKPNTPVKIGLRSGAEPVSATIELGGSRQTIRLASHSQETVALRPVSWRHQQIGTPEIDDVFVVPLTVHCHIGAVWLTVLDDPREVWNYSVFGGDQPDGRRPQADGIQSDLFSGDTEQIHYLRSREPRRLRRSSDGPGEFKLLPRNTALAAGAYALTLDLTDVQKNTAVELVVAGVRSGGQLEHTREHLEIKDTQRQIHYQFTKPFAPYECTIVVSCTEGGAVITGWNLEPDGERILSDLTRMHSDGSKPDWLRPEPEAWVHPPSAQFTGVLFDDAIELIALDFPERATAGDTVELATRVRLGRYTDTDFGHLALFCHVIDDAGAVLFAFGCELRQCAFDRAGQAAIPVTLPPDLAPGTLRLRVGIWNTRTRHRLPLTGQPASLEHDEDSVNLRTIEILPPKS
ncbi:MAG: glycosyltransferase family 39 protein [Verrucomicrobia bacterium]|nr:glycosyltransferase family 39 protein [Verrucomicrobiota bacterium]